MRKYEFNAAKQRMKSLSGFGIISARMVLTAML